jgi:flagellar hook assembly protein FlgD
VYDNTSITSTEFNVEPQSSLQLQHVLNYPDPFTTHTQFFFEINEVCDQMDVQVQIFSVSGKLVKNILTSVKTNSFRSEPIDWDGRDDYGDRIARGVYIYHIKVRTSNGETADTYQKLVIL